MSSFSVSAAGLSPAGIVSRKLQRSASSRIRRVAFMVASLAIIMPFGRIVLCGQPYRYAAPPADCAVPADIGATRNGRRRKARRTDPPIDSSVRAACYSRFSSALQDESSILDQQRKCREKASANGHEISADFEFSDQAVSGTKRHRDGLDAMLAAAKAGAFSVLYFHSLSRLSRESVITLPLLKELVHNYGVRVISVTEGIDSDDTAWELIAHIMSIVHEQYLKDLAENVHRGQEGAVLAGFAVGDHCFGFSSVPIPGSEQGRRGRNPKPRKTYVIDPETAAWVPRIFNWFVRERRSLRWIMRELNRLRAPKDHRATTAQWRHQYLPKLLKNRKYIGWWPWGEKKNVRNPLTGAISQKDRSPEETEKWLRHLPHLQLIDDKTFEDAGRLLRENEQTCGAKRRKKGRLAGSKPNTSHQHPRHLLSGLVCCSECGRTFNVGGSGGKYLFCPGYSMGECSCKTQLRRDRAERMIVNEIGKQILASPSWRQRVLEEALKAWNSQEASVPSEMAAARRSLADLEQKIIRLVNHIEDGRGGPELDERLAQRRAEKREVSDRVKKLERAGQDRRQQPTESWIDEQLCSLGEVLAQSTPAAAHALRDLVGGEIVVMEIRQPDRQRHYLQGKFAITSGAIVAGLVETVEECGRKAASDYGDFREEFVIDFREPLEIEVLSERAKELYDDGLLNAQIAEVLGRARSYVTKLLKHWHESRGLEMPDGRARRSTLKQKHQKAPRYQEIAGQVKVLLDEGILLEEIAQRVGCDRNTVTKAVECWHTSRSLPVPDGRTRRKSLARKVSHPRHRPGDKDTEAGDKDTDAQIDG